RGYRSPVGGCRRFPEAAWPLGLLHCRDRSRDLDGGGAPVERATGVDQEPLVAGLAAAETSTASLELDPERCALDDHVAADAQALGVELLDRLRGEVDLGVLLA